LIFFIFITHAAPCAAESSGSACWKLGFFDSGILLEKSARCYPGSDFSPSFLAMWLNNTEDMYLCNTLLASRNERAEEADSEFVSTVERLLTEIPSKQSAGVESLVHFVHQANVSAGSPFNLVVQETSVLYSNQASWCKPDNDLTTEIEILIQYPSIHNPRPRVYKPTLFQGKIAYLDLVQLYAELAEPRLPNVKQHIAEIACRPISEKAMISLLKLRQAGFRLITIAHDICPGCPTHFNPNYQKVDPALEANVREAIRKIAQSRGYVLVVDINGVWYGGDEFRKQADDITSELESQLSTRSINP